MERSWVSMLFYASLFGVTIAALGFWLVTDVGIALAGVPVIHDMGMQLALLLG